MDGLSGYKAGSHLARLIALRLHPEQADGLSDTGFPSPEGWVRATVCPLSGHLAGESCSGAFEEWFPPGKGPVETCAVHRVEGGRVVVDLPPRYAAWQAAEGMPGPAHPPRSDTRVTLTLLSPTDGTRVVSDPESAPGRSTIELAVAVDPPVDEVLWVVDGQPFAVVAAPYEVRWPLAPGEHVFEARLPWRPERSGSARVLAQ